MERCRAPQPPLLCLLLGQAPSSLCADVLYEWSIIELHPDILLPVNIFYTIKHIFELNNTLN